jgi:hypothetical protein
MDEGWEFIGVIVGGAVIVIAAMLAFVDAAGRRRARAASIADRAFMKIRRNWTGAARSSRRASQRFAYADQHRQQTPRFRPLISLWQPIKDVADRAGTAWVRAEKRLADELARMRKTNGAAGPARGKASSKAGRAFNDAPARAELGIDKHRSARAAKVAEIPQQTLAAHDARRSNPDHRLRFRSPGALRPR